MHERIKVLGGDFATKDGWWDGEYLHLFGLNAKGQHPDEVLHARFLTSVEVLATQEVKRLLPAIGWATAGNIVLGPVGLLAGAFFGGNSADVTVRAQFWGVRTKVLLATMSVNAYANMLACKERG